MAYHRPRPSVDGLNAVSLVWRAGTMQCHLCGVQAQDDTPCSELCGKQRLPAQQKRWERCNPAQKQWNPAPTYIEARITLLVRGWPFVESASSSSALHARRILELLQAGRHRLDRLLLSLPPLLLSLSFSRVPCLLSSPLFPLRAWQQASGVGS